MALEANNITKLFGRQKALDNASISVQKGEIVGFLGPNGAGKSTLMKIINGYLPADGGEVYVNGVKVSPQDIEIRRDIGYLPENNPLYTDLYIREFLEITAGFYRIPDKKKRVGEMVELTGLGDEQHKKISALSKGYRQRVGLAQALIHNPSVLILDEPTTGLDPNQLEEIRGLIREISKEKTVMLSSHIMQEVEAICNRVVIINKGKIVANGGISEIKSGNLSQRQVVLVEFNQKPDRDKLRAVKGVENIQADGDLWSIESDGKQDIRPLIFNFAVGNKLTLLTLQEKQQDLEKVFQQLTKGTA